MSNFFSKLNMQIKAHHVIITLFIIVPIYSILVLTFTRYRQVEAELVLDNARTINLDTISYLQEFDIDASGNAFVYNSDFVTIEKYDSDGFFVADSIALPSVLGVAVSEVGHVYATVIEAEWETVWHFDNDLNYVDKYYIAPSVMDVGVRGLGVANGYAYVATEYYKTIFSVNLSTGVVSIHNESPLLLNPVDVEVDTSGAEDVLYVLSLEASYGNPQIYYCNVTGCAEGNEGTFAIESEYPWKLAIDDYGYVYVLDLYLPGLQIYDSAHAYVENLPLSSTYNDVTFFNGRIYLLETGAENNALAFFQYNETPEVTPTPTPILLEDYEFDNFPGYTLPSFDVTVSGDSTTATMEPGINEPTYIDGIEIGNTAWFNYYSPADATLTVSTCTTEFDSGLAVYTGDPGDPYDLAELYIDNEGASFECLNGYYGASYNVEIYQDYNYYIQFGGQYSASGYFEVSFTTNGTGPTPTPSPIPGANNDDFADAIELFIDDYYFSEGIVENGTLEIDEPDTIIYDKVPLQNSAWWKFTAPYDTNISISACDLERANMKMTLAVYTGTELSNLSKVIDNQWGCGNDGAKVFLAITEGTTYYIQVSIMDFGEHFEYYPLHFYLELIEEVDYTESAPNDDFENAIEVEPDIVDVNGEYVPYSITSSRNSTMQAGEPDAAKYTMDPRSVWWKWTNDGTAREIWVDTCNNPGPGEVDTLLSIYTGTSVNDLTLVAENDEFRDDTSDATWWCYWSTYTSFLTFQAEPDTTYYIRMLDISNRNFAMHMTIRNRPEFHPVEAETPFGDRYCENHGGIARFIPYGMDDSGGSELAWEQCYAWCNANMDDEFALCQDNGDSPRACWLNRAPEGGMDNCNWVEPAPGWQHPRGAYVGQSTGYILSLDPDLRATLVSNLEMDVTVFKQLGERGIYVLDSDDSMIMANLSVLFDSNHDWTDLNGEVDLVGGKVFIDDPSSQPGAIGAYNLMAPILESDPSDYLLLCPDAESILDVSETCLNAQIVSAADEGVSIVTGSDGNDYWMVENLTVSMGAMNYTIPYVPECGNDILDVGEQCDGDNLGGYSCSSFPGYNSGDLSCSISCEFDIAECSYVEPSVSPTPTTPPTPTPTVSLPPGVSATPVPSPTPTPLPSCIYNTEDGLCIEDLEIGNVRTSTRDGSIEICWDSNAPSKGAVRYGYNGLMDKITLPEIEEKLVDHCVTISDVEYDREYDYRIDIEYGPYLDSFIGTFEIKDIDYDSQCHIYLNKDYSFSEDGNVSFTFTTDNTSYCTLSYGSDPTDMDAYGDVLPYISSFKGIMDIGLDNRLNVYYQVSCVSVVNQCSASDVISAKALAPLMEEVGLLSPQNRSLIATSAISLSLIGIVLAFTPIALTSPNILMYGVIWFLPRKKNKPWGIVYDLLNHKAVPFAVVRVYGEDGKLIKQSVSDMEGKYSFIMDQGSYRLEAAHQEFAPFSQQVTVNSTEEQLALDIPLQKAGDMKGLNSRKIAHSMLTGTGWTIGVIGLLLSIVALIFNTNVFNLIVVILYLMQIAMLLFIRPVRNWGYLYDAGSKQRLKGGFLRVIDKAQGRQIELQMSDDKGRFGFRLPKGDYYLSVSVPGYDYSDPSSLFTLQDGTRVLDIGEGKISDVSIAMSKKEEQVLPPQPEQGMNAI